MTKKLAIVGGGPKAAALVSRAAVLRDMGVANVPDLLVFEKKAVGSAWSGDGGYSSGHLTLCSPAEKDVGFPYVEFSAENGEQSIASALHARFSWSAYLVATGSFSEWVDRGRDHPTHGIWADYLKWVFVKADQGIVPGEVIKVKSQSGGGWHITYVDDEDEVTTEVDGVVLTGTGEAKVISGLTSNIPTERLLNAETFWRHRNQVRKWNEIAVTGAGGAAGAIVAWLSNALAEESDATIRSISPMGTLFLRGDGYAERRWFTDPDAWTDLSLGDRRRLLERTEAGVISSRNKSIIDSACNVDYVLGKAINASWDDSELTIDITYDGQNQKQVTADCLINAIGFDAWSLLKLVDAVAVRNILDPTNKKIREQLEGEILPDLSFPVSAGLGTGLHVPSLAALAHGPGMATLGSLGLLASAILKSYL
ncbi:SidA/IucD/PvdA family monooxygenase [Acetobacter suratthaniensis]|uniref:SidA/IucD/PvdA family monooxygenase n=1 Tax=Acetobacter suratthaniensis TaxID=1502841 RepID=A0ABS3LQ76_9PROT|nr:SidA/IucD/PvdA family monooxygenase [Acetobacter suratthaniensis]MBO1329520.1 SidA/IucD/PvdA family monooxygenase [Acetobacter suratthaniensis]MCX2567578.1 SidA/IucD/PvdA family monooxygenase [Acetobacter suratthaniensis]